MKQYTIRTGDTLFSIARSNNSTIEIIMKDNPQITNRNQISAGQVISIRTVSEVAKAQSTQAKNAQAKNKVKIQSVQEKRPATLPALPTTFWSGKKITEFTNWRVVVLKTLPLVYFDGKEAISVSVKEIRMLSVNENHVVVKTVTLPATISINASDGYSYGFDSLYYIGENKFVPIIDGFVELQPVPQDKKEELANQDDKKTTNKPTQNIIPSTPEFEFRDYKRPVLQIKKEGQNIGIELRIVSASGQYSNSWLPYRTNAGWMINAGGNNLMTKTISGFFIDSKGQQEFDAFMQFYSNYLTAYRDGDYYSSAICTLYYKEREYKGLIANFNYTDNEAVSLARSFSMGFLVLSEKGPDVLNLTNKSAATTKKNEGYVSDLRILLGDPDVYNLGRD